MDYKNQTVSDLHTSLQSNTQQLCAKMDTLDLKMVSVNASMREELRAMENQLEEFKQQTASVDLHNSLQSEQLTQLCAKMDTLYSKLVSVNAQCTPVPLLSMPTLFTSPTSLPPSPTSLPPSPTSLPPSPTSLPPSPTLLPCGGTGWRRVVYLNFTDPNTRCPSGWRLTSHSKRTCGRVNTGGLSCDSVTFPVSGGDYTRVCGRIIAYQDRYTSAFWTYHDGLVTTIDGPYVEGVSLTHDSPRQHIWTFASGYYEFNPTYTGVCPCDTTINITIPPFVGGDYFCESGHNSEPVMYRFHSDDPLWDGDGCTASSTCCSFNNPPYFTKQLPSPTSDDIETRICHYSRYGDVPIEFIELYVQ